MSDPLSQAKSTFKAHARTFSLAARFLPRQRYDAVARLYAFCRELDDLADAGPAGINHDQLLGIRQDICCGESRDLAVQDMLALQQQFSIPTTLVVDFIDTLIEDQYPRQLQSVDDLVRFAYGVASTVGLMMCHIFGVHDKRALPFAVDLGVAMQMSNVARDILEDAERGRIYIPADLTPGQVTCRGLLDADQIQRQRAYTGATRLLGIADEYYASASMGYGYLPRAVRHAIKVAARLYQAIGDKIVANPQDYWQQRTVIPADQKCWLIADLFVQRLREGSSTQFIGKVEHPRYLHQALDPRRFTA